MTDFTFLALGSANDSPSVGPCFETYLGEAFRLEPGLEEGVIRVLEAGEELDSARAFPVPTAKVACFVEDVPESRIGDLSGEETISSTKGRAYLEVLVFL